MSAKTIGFIFWILGAGCFLVCLILYYFDQQFMQTAEQAIGIVKRLEEKASDDGGWIYYPVISFTTDTGKEVEVRGNFGSNPPTYGEGAEVTVFYQSDNPHHFKLDEFWSRFFVMIILLFIGTIFLVVGGGIMRYLP